ncbi:MAG TPA: hypothetical protein VK154_00230 [Chitinophagales bacterium]|nr:hypothetical protein [Chitinophagales bacterium]
MKRLLLVLSTALLLTAISSCEKTDDTGNKNDTSLCNDGILNGGETEIDCGAACDDCPPPATMSCTLGNTSFVAHTCYGMILGPNIRIYGNDNRPVHFMFVPSQLNVELPINAVSFAYNGEAYAMEPGDSGRVVLTYLDTVRKIASGSFYFTGNRVTGPNSASVTGGAFANVRYDH